MSTEPIVSMDKKISQPSKLRAALAALPAASLERPSAAQNETSNVRVVAAVTVTSACCVVLPRVEETTE